MKQLSIATITIDMDGKYDKIEIKLFKLFWQEVKQGNILFFCFIILCGTIYF